MKSLFHLSPVQEKEKHIAKKLNWNLNAVTIANFIDELSRPLALYFETSLIRKVVTHSLTLANVSLLSEYTSLFLLFTHLPITSHMIIYSTQKCLCMLSLDVNTHGGAL